jgi:hypothetical protein
MYTTMQKHACTSIQMATEQYLNLYELYKCVLYNTNSPAAFYAIINILAHQHVCFKFFWHNLEVPGICFASYQLQTAKSK